MKGLSARLTMVLDRWFLACSPPDLCRALSAHFGQPLSLRTMWGRGAASVFRADGSGGEPIAVVKVINWRRERRSRRINDPSPHFRFFSGPKRLAREFEILEKLSPHGLAPSPLLLDEHFAVHEYCPGPLLVVRLLREPNGAFEMGWKALRQVHASGMHHGDAGPQNIIDSPGGLKFIDFEHSLDEGRYDFNHMMAYDYLRYSYHSWRFSANLDESIYRRYLLEGEGGLPGPVAEAAVKLLVSIPLDRAFLSRFGKIP